MSRFALASSEAAYLLPSCEGDHANPAVHQTRKVYASVTLGLCMGLAVTTLLPHYASLGQLWAGPVAQEVASRHSLSLLGSSKGSGGWRAPSLLIGSALGGLVAGPGIAHATDVEQGQTSEGGQAQGDVQTQDANSFTYGPFPDAAPTRQSMRAMQQPNFDGIEPDSPLVDSFTGGLSSTAVYIYAALALPITLAVVLFLGQTGAMTARINKGIEEEKQKQANDMAREARLARLYPKKPPTTSDSEGEATLEVVQGNEMGADASSSTGQRISEQAPPVPGSMEDQFREELKRRAAGGDFPRDKPQQLQADPLDSDDLQGLPRRLVNLARFGATFWFGLWPVVIATLGSILLTNAVFGSSWIHRGEAPKPVVFDLETLEPIQYDTRTAPPVTELK